MGHVGFEILPKGFTKNKWWNWNTAITHHNMHHQYFHSNYGLYFTWWDKLMKTEHKDYHEAFDEVKSRPKACELKSTKRKSIPISVLLLFIFGIILGQSDSMASCSLRIESLFMLTIYL